MPKVSVIVPVYNGEKVLRRCVESILNQDNQDLELILVNDGSRDGSAAVMEELARQDSRVRAVSKPNGGVSSTRNLALDMAQGEYIQFVDVDDWLPLESTKLLMREMELGGAELVVADFYRVVDDNISQKGSIGRSGLLTLRQYADEMLLRPADLYFGVLWNKLYRRDIIEKYHLRMDESISYSEDMLFNLSYLRHVEHVRVLKAPVYYYIYTPGSLVDQSLNLSSTVKMKSSVIGAYNDFYRASFDKADYEERLPLIYGYLFAVSTDSLSIPFAPGTRKLGQENGENLDYSSALNDSPLLGDYWSRRFFEQYLDTVAKKHDLAHGEVVLLYLLHRLHRCSSAEELAAYAGLTQANVHLLMARLVLRGLVTRDKDDWLFAADDLAQELDQAEGDFSAVCFEGLTPDERNTLYTGASKVRRNILRHLSAVQIKNAE